MKLGLKPGLVAGLAVLALAPPASAAPVTVNLRVEGADTTLFERPVTTDARTTVDGHDNSGPHPCDGTNKGSATPVPTVGAAMVAALGDTATAWTANWFGSGTDDYFLDSVLGERPDYNATQTYWTLWLDGQGASLGMCGSILHPGEDVLWAVAKDGQDPLKLSGPSRATRGEAVSVSVTNARSGGAVPGATVATATTGPDGRATITLGDIGTTTVKATKAGLIRSNALSIAVTASGAPPSATGGSLADRAAPAARLLGIRDHRVFARGKGPRTLRATAPDPSGLAAVKLRLTRRASGRCAYFSGRRAAFVRTRCGRAFFFKVGTEPSVSYLLPARLGPGRYVLDLTAVDRAGNRTALARGSTRVVFTVR